jgi:hypothetical protein
VSLTLANVQPVQQGDYWAVVSNGAGAVTTLVARLTVILLDSDGDGMPDDWEIAHGLNPHDPADASADPDGDRMSNLEEYIAGTDPHDPLSVLKVQLDQPGGGGALIRFMAMPNISYTVQYVTNVVGLHFAEGPWLKLRDVAPQPGTNTIEVLDPDALPGTRRYYRIATPRQP